MKITQAQDCLEPKVARLHWHYNNNCNSCLKSCNIHLYKRSR